MGKNRTLGEPALLHVLFPWLTRTLGGPALLHALAATAPHCSLDFIAYLAGICVLKDPYACLECSLCPWFCPQCSFPCLWAEPHTHAAPAIITPCVCEFTPFFLDSDCITGTLCWVTALCIHFRLSSDFYTWLLGSFRCLHSFCALMS